MHAIATVNKYRETSLGTDLIITIPEMRLSDMLQWKNIQRAEIRFDDGRHISIEQRKKAYATIRDISDYTGYLPEEQKEWMKYLHICRTGDDYFSLSNCSMDTAREFINTILEYAIQEGIPLSGNAIERTDDIGMYLYFCLMNRKCAICGQPGEIHHEDAIGMGNDRRTVDDSGHRKICLCRLHHTLAHQMGVERFRRTYKVYGIIVMEEIDGENKNSNSGCSGNQEESFTDCEGWREGHSTSQQTVSAI